jgi:tRNA (mo5U34)-methyltransferase
MPYYKPDELPGKIGFDTAHRALGSRVEVVVGDFMDMDLKPLGEFDVVLYLGSLYHMEDPLRAMKRVAAVTKELAIIETEAAVFPTLEDHALCEFFESNELNGDVSNWWAPNEKALVGLCRAAGFKRAEIVAGPNAAPAEPLIQKLRSAARAGLAELSLRKVHEASEVRRYRATAHAWK